MNFILLAVQWECVCVCAHVNCLGLIAVVGSCGEESRKFLNGVDSNLIAFCFIMWHMFLNSCNASFFSDQNEPPKDKGSLMYCTLFGGSTVH